MTIILSIALSQSKIYSLNLEDEEDISRVNNEIVKLEVDDFLMIAAIENPSTGYSWVINAPNNNTVSPVYSIYSDFYERVDATQSAGHPIVGMGGIRTFTI